MPIINGQKRDATTTVVDGIASHFSQQMYWYGKDPVDAFLKVNCSTPWQLTTGAGVDTFGAWVQLSNGDEINGGSATIRYHPHVLYVTSIDTADKVYFLQLATGESGSQVVQTAFAYISSDANKAAAGATEVPMPCVGANEKLWARASCGLASKTIDFIMSVHLSC